MFGEAKAFGRRIQFYFIDFGTKAFEISFETGYSLFLSI
jgi:hypothetical protein